jgi:hypothetical protein
LIRVRSVTRPLIVSPPKSVIVSRLVVASKDAIVPAIAGAASDP